jgi:hypothetical protein
VRCALRRAQPLARGGTARPYPPVLAHHHARGAAGDFFQLPPVGRNTGAPAKFAFEARCWPLVVQETIVLDEVFRQRDWHFVKLLNEMRRGDLSPFHVSLLRCHVQRRHARASSPENSPPARDLAAGAGARCPPTRLVPLNATADAANRQQLARLAGAPRVYTAHTHGARMARAPGCLPQRALARRTARRTAQARRATWAAASRPSASSSRSTRR